MERINWTEWEPWRKLWEDWVRYRAGDKNIAMEHIQFIDLYNFFVRQAKALAMAGHEVDVKAFLDPVLTFDENKKILAELMRVPPTEKDYEVMYDGYKAALESEVKEKYPEVVQEWEKKIQKLERETEHLPKVEREREKFKRLSEDLARELEQTRQRSKQEKEGLEKKVAPVKLRILRGFKEGILEYSVGSIVETRDIDWAIQKIDQGFAERVGVEPIVLLRPTPSPAAPPKEVFRPPEKPPEKQLIRVLPPLPEKCPHDQSPLEEVTRVPIFIPDPLHLEPEEEYWRASVGLPIPTKEVEWIDVPSTMKIWMCQMGEHYFERDAMGRLVERTAEYLYRRILRETARVRRVEAPAAEFVPPEVRTRFLQWVRRWEAPEAGRKAYQLHPKDWLLTKGLAWGDFLKLPDEQRKALLDEYERLSRERK